MHIFYLQSEDHQKFYQFQAADPKECEEENQWGKRSLWGKAAFQARSLVTAMIKGGGTMWQAEHLVGQRVAMWNKTCLSFHPSLAKKSRIESCNCTLLWQQFINTFLRSRAHSLLLFDLLLHEGILPHSRELRSRVAFYKITKSQSLELLQSMEVWLWPWWLKQGLVPGGVEIMFHCLVRLGKRLTF